MDPQETAQAASTVAQVLARTNDARAETALGGVLAALATRLGPQEAGRAADALTRAIARAHSANSGLPGDLVAVAARMEPEEAARLCTQAFDALTRAMARATDPYSRAWLAHGLAELAARLGPQEAAKAADALARASAGMDEASGESASLQLQLAQDMAAIATRIEPREATRLYAQAAQGLTHALARGTGGYGQAGLAKGLASLAPRLGPQEAAQAIEAIAKTRASGFEPQSASEVVAALAARLGPQEAAQAAGALTRAISETENPGAQLELARALAAMAPRLGPQEAAPAADALVQALTVHARTSPPTAPVLGQALGAVVARMEARRAADTLARAVASTDDLFVLSVLSWEVSPVAARLESPEAALLRARAASAIIRAMARTTDLPEAYDATPSLSPVRPPGGLPPLPSAQPPSGTRPLGLSATRLWDSRYLGLSAALAPTGEPELSRRSTAIVAGVVSPAGAGTPLVTLAHLGPTLQPLPCALSTQELVELLKQPICVGPARRIILDWLEVRYGRRFADQWEFVHFAQEEHLGLDFTRPPKRLVRLPGDAEK
jgi:hypothetical protein